nr:MAG TPA: arabinose operon regulatory protein [Caudoviricetes sp.]
MSDLSLEVINEKLEMILDLLSDNSNRSFSISEFSKELGITPYKLKEMYRRNKLAIASPYRMNGCDPRYSMKDFIYMKTWLRAHER